MIDDNNQEMTRSKKFKKINTPGKHKFSVFMLIIFLFVFVSTFTFKHNLINKDAINKEQVTNEVEKHINSNYQQYLTQQGINENILSKSYISDIVDIEVDNIYTHGNLELTAKQVQPTVNQAISNENSKTAFKIPNNPSINKYISKLIVKGFNEYINTSENQELLIKFKTFQKWLNISIILSACLVIIILIYSLFRGYFIHLIKWSLLLTAICLFIVYFTSDIINTSMPMILKYISSTHLDSFYNDMCFYGLVSLITSLLLFVMHKFVKP
ncbi:hypothetical protein LNP07_03930 [Apilactobacillus sp. M161]|uniref:Uncharacterized protein n=1 Tax=Apilactobacillus xinyiensis TaxID=2841032 RepID=A0ABT0I1R0_9LACO|nr:hypothetical protein [Apilactobacillus xinyiensis]MCK8624658.1 hypothetical protein [Apilactobacillus xinyiensis]